MPIASQIRRGTKRLLSSSWGHVLWNPQMTWPNTMLQTVFTSWVVSRRQSRSTRTRYKCNQNSLRFGTISATLLAHQIDNKKLKRLLIKVLNWIQAIAQPGIISATASTCKAALQKRSRYTPRWLRWTPKPLKLFITWQAAISMLEIFQRQLGTTRKQSKKQSSLI